MTPDKIIWALMLFVVAPSAFFSRAAVVTLLTFLLGYLAWRVGMPEPPTQLFLYVVALCVGIGTARTLAHQVAMALFLPLAGSMIAWMMGGLSDIEAWNIAFWLTLMQIAAVPFGNDWAAIHAVVRKVGRALPAGRMEMTFGLLR